MEEKLLRDHHRVVEIANNLKDILRETNAPNAQSLASARWAFAAALMQHLAVKERHLYAKFEHDDRPFVKAYFEKSKTDLLKCFQSYTDHIATWSTANALAKWKIYQIKAVHVVDIFIERLHAESELLEFAKRHDIDINTPSMMTTNWTRKAFELKDKVDEQ